MSTGLPNSIVTKTILILHSIIKLSPICAVRKILCRPKDISSMEYLITYTTWFTRFLEFLISIVTNILKYQYTFSGRCSSSEHFIYVLCPVVADFFGTKSHKVFQIIFLKLLIVANTKQHHFMTCSKLKSYCQLLKSAEYWIYNKQHNTHYLTYCDMETDESGIFL